MGADERIKYVIQSPRLRILLTWSLCMLLLRSSVNSQTLKVEDRVWAEHVLVSRILATNVSNDGSATILASFSGLVGCPMGNLSLVFPNATANGSDVSVPGEMSSECRAAAFYTGATANFQSLRAGSHWVQMQLGPNKRLITFAAVPSSSVQARSSTNSSGTVQSNVTLIKVVQAATASFLGQSSAISRTHATVTLTVGLTGPVEVTTSVGLRVWDPSAVEIDPALLTWQAGESNIKAFNLRLTRAAPSGQAVAWAELMHGENILFNTSSPPRLAIEAARPKFKVVPSQTLYRGSNNPSSSDNDGGRNTRSSSSSAGSIGGAFVLFTPLAAAGAPRLELVAVEIQRTNASPFGSTLHYRANVLQMAGCSSSACAAAVSGSGLLRFSADNSSVSAILSVNWTALPDEASLAVGLQLTPIENAELVEAAVNTVSLYVHGSLYGTCPAGTLGPWRDPFASPLPQQAPSNAGSAPPSNVSGDATDSLVVANGGNATIPSTLPSASAQSSPPMTPCNATARLRSLNDYNPAEAMLPGLSACVGEEVALVYPFRTAVPPASSGSQPQLPEADDTRVTVGNTTTPSQPAAAPSGDGDGDVGNTLVEFLVPFDQDALSVFVPLGSTNETVFVSNSNCDPQPGLIQSARPSLSSAHGVAAWAELTLPTYIPHPCYVLLRVYASVWSGQSAATHIPTQTPPSTPTPTQPSAFPMPPTPPTRLSQPGGRSSVNMTGAALSPFPTASSGKLALPTPSSSSSSSSSTRQEVLRPPPGSSTGNNTTSGNYPPPPSPARTPARTLTSMTAPLPAPTNTFGASSVPILSMVQLRMFNVTLRPRSDPDIFSAGSLSLYLLNRSSGRSLPLCGLAQPMLQAAAAQVFGDTFDPASQLQLDAAGWTLAQAIRGDPNAMAALDGSSGSGVAGGSHGGVELGNRRMLHVGKSLRRWLATWMDTDYRLQSPGRDTSPAAQQGHAGPGNRHVQVRLLRGLAARRHAEVYSKRRSRQLNSSTSPLPAQVQAPPLPPLPKQAPPPRRPLAAPGPPSPVPAPIGLPAESVQRPLSAGSPQLRPAPEAKAASPLAPPPALNSLPLPEASRRPVPSYPGAPLAPDGFDLAAGLGEDGSMRVLCNPRFALWCHTSDAQVVNLALIKGSDGLSLEASSLGGDLRLGAPGTSGDGSTEMVTPAEVVLGPALRSQILQQQQQQEAAAAGGPLYRPVGGDWSDESNNINNNNVSMGGACNCSGQPPEADKRVAVSLVAPDGVSTALIELRLYADYEAALAAADRAASGECQDRCNPLNADPNGIANNTSSISANQINISSSVGTGTGSSGLSGRNSSAPTAGESVMAATESDPFFYTRSAAPWIASSSRPLLTPMSSPVTWTACQPCGPGSFSDTVNATSCQPCGPGTASNGTYNKECAACDPGTFSVQSGSTSCRPCYAGSYAPRPGSTVCLVCPEGTTSVADGARECVVPPRPGKGDTAIVVSFQVLLNMSTTRNNSDAQAASATGMSDVPMDSIYKLLIAADTAAALRIAPSMVRVSLMELSPSTFLVNVSATMRLTQTPGTGTGSSPVASDGSPGDPGVDADILINRLVGNPDNSFPRTKEATGGSLQVQYLQRQVVLMDERAGKVNPHVVVWPTLAGTCLLAIVVGFACSRYCRRRRVRLGLTLPPISDAFGRFCKWKYPTSPPPRVAFPYGSFMGLELQEQSPNHSATRHRMGRSTSKPNLSSLGMSLASGSTDTLSTMSTSVDLDAVAIMYTKDVLAAPRI